MCGWPELFANTRHSPWFLVSSRLNALVLGSTGAIGAEFVRALRVNALDATPVYARVAALARSTDPGFDLTREASMAAAAAAIADQGPFHLIVDATGALAINGVGPEKHLGALNSEQLLASFQINAVGPALLMKHFMPLLAPSGRVVYAKLSARVGSIADNRKGGWYGYRASKAALNMLLQTAAIECQRRRPDAIIAALQPGTVASALSKPHVDPKECLTPRAAVRGMLAALDGLQPGKGAQFVDCEGRAIPW